MDRAPRSSAPTATCGSPRTRRRTRPIRVPSSLPARRPGGTSRSPLAGCGSGPASTRPPGSGWPGSGRRWPTTSPDRSCSECSRKLEKGGFEISGERLKTSPRGYDADHPRIELLRHKQLFAGKSFGFEGLDSPDVLDRVRGDWRASAPWSSGWPPTRISGAGRFEVGRYIVGPRSCMDADPTRHPARPGSRRQARSPLTRVREETSVGPRKQVSEHVRRRVSPIEPSTILGDGSSKRHNYERDKHAEAHAPRGRGTCRGPRDQWHLRRSRRWTHHLREDQERHHSHGGREERHAQVDRRQERHAQQGGLQRRRQGEAGQGRDQGPRRRVGVHDLAGRWQHRRRPRLPRLAPRPRRAPTAPTAPTVLDGTDGVTGDKGDNGVQRVRALRGRCQGRQGRPWRSCITAPTASRASRRTASTVPRATRATVATTAPTGRRSDGEHGAKGDKGDAATTDGSNGYGDEAASTAPRATRASVASKGPRANGPTDADGEHGAKGTATRA